MAFWGSSFIYRGKSCREFGMMIYDIGDTRQDSIFSFPSVGTPIEDRIPTRYDGFYYGIQYDSPLEFSIVFGIDPELIDENKSLDKFEVESIASWLTGWQDMDWLYILQPDMETFRYKCIVTGFESISYGMMPYAFRMTVRCDSPFGYMKEQIYEYTVQDSLETTFFNRSTYNGYYMPKLKIRFGSNLSFDITNQSDDNRKFSLTVPVSNIVVSVDNLNGIIKDETNGDNLYDGFNFNFFRLKKGNNALLFEGDAVIQIITEFPVNIGG